MTTEAEDAYYGMRGNAPAQVRAWGDHLERQQEAGQLDHAEVAEFCESALESLGLRAAQAANITDAVASKKL